MPSLSILGIAIQSKMYVLHPCTQSCNFWHMHSYYTIKINFLYSFVIAQSIMEYLSKALKDKVVNSSTTRAPIPIVVNLPSLL